MTLERFTLQAYFYTKCGWGYVQINSLVCVFRQRFALYAHFYTMCGWGYVQIHSLVDVFRERCAYSLTFSHV